MNTVSREINRLVYMRPVTVIIPLGAAFRTGGMAGISFGTADWLRVRRIAQRGVTDCSCGSGSSFEWTSLTNAKLVVEYRPAYGQDK